MKDNFRTRMVQCCCKTNKDVKTVGKTIHELKAELKAELKEAEEKFKTAELESLIRRIVREELNKIRKGNNGKDE